MTFLEAIASLLEKNRKDRIERMDDHRNQGCKTTSFLDFLVLPGCKR